MIFDWVISGPSWFFVLLILAYVFIVVYVAVSTVALYILGTADTIAEDQCQNPERCLAAGSCRCNDLLQINGDY